MKFTAMTVVAVLAGLLWPGAAAWDGDDYYKEDDTSVDNGDTSDKQDGGNCPVSNRTSNSYCLIRLCHCNHYIAML